MKTFDDVKAQAPYDSQRVQNLEAKAEAVSSNGQNSIIRQTRGNFQCRSRARRRPFLSKILNGLRGSPKCVLLRLQAHGVFQRRFTALGE